MSERRLSAILFSDIVGYTALMERDEALGIGARERHRELLDRLVAEFQGRLVETPGDEALAVFPSVLLAVDCALSLQAELQGDKDLSLRIGLHLGDVVERDGEVMGDAVNIAARIRPLAEPGAICVSEAVWSVVRNRPGLMAQPLGRKTLKNVDGPVQVWAIAPGEAGRVARTRRLRRAAAALALSVVLLGGAWFAIGDVVVAWAVLSAWPLVANPLEQEIGFATTSDGVRIAYGVTGNGPVLVSVLGFVSHLDRGIGSPLYDRFGMIRKMSQRYRFVRYDGRGFGLSQRDVDDFSLDARVRDLEAVVDAVGVDRVALWATSAGGPAAVAYASRHPDRVSHLVLFGVMMGGWRHTSVERKEMLPELLAMLRAHWDSPEVRGMLVEMLAPGVGGIERRVVSEFIAASGDGTAVAGFLGANEQIDIVKEASRIRVPTLVVHGRQDGTVPVANGIELASLIQGAQLELYDGDHITKISSAKMHWVIELISDFVTDPARR